MQVPDPHHTRPTASFLGTTFLTFAGSQFYTMSLLIPTEPMKISRTKIPLGTDLFLHGGIFLTAMIASWIQENEIT
jgi:hypothetical protein